MKSFSKILEGEMNRKFKRINIKESEYKYEDPQVQAMADELEKLGDEVPYLFITLDEFFEDGDPFIRIQFSEEPDDYEGYTDLGLESHDDDEEDEDDEDYDEEYDDEEGSNFYELDEKVSLASEELLKDIDPKIKAIYTKYGYKQTDREWVDLQDIITVEKK